MCLCFWPSNIPDLQVQYFVSSEQWPSANVIILFVPALISYLWVNCGLLFAKGINFIAGVTYQTLTGNESVSILEWSVVRYSTARLCAWLLTASHDYTLWQINTGLRIWNLRPVNCLSMVKLVRVKVRKWQHHNPRSFGLLEKEKEGPSGFAARVLTDMMDAWPTLLQQMEIWSDFRCRQNALMRCFATDKIWDQLRFHVGIQRHSKLANHFSIVFDSGGCHCSLQSGK